MLYELEINQKVSELVNLHAIEIDSLAEDKIEGKIIIDSGSELLALNFSFDKSDKRIVLHDDKLIITNKLSGFEIQRIKDILNTELEDYEPGKNNTGLGLNLSPENVEAKVAILKQAIIGIVSIAVFFYVIKVVMEKW